MRKFDFLNYSEVLNDETKLEVLKNYDFNPLVTDFAVLLGVYPEHSLNLKKRTAYFWITNILEDNPNLIWQVENNHKKLSKYLDNKTGLLLSFSMNDLDRKDYNIYYKNDIYEIISFGYYPQDLTNNYLSPILERLYQKEYLKETGNSYKTIEDSNTFIHKEYIYLGYKYIRYTPKKDSNNVLSNGDNIIKDRPYWLNVRPLFWIVDRKDNKAIATKILFNIGINEKDITNTGLNINNIHRFIDESFAKEIIQNKKEYDYEIINQYGYNDYLLKTKKLLKK